MTDTKEIKSIPTDTSDDSYNYKRDHNKSMREIAMESNKRLRDMKTKLLEKADAKPEKEEVVQKEIKEEVKNEEVKEEKKEVNVEEVRKLAQEEATKIAAETARKTFQEETQKILDQKKSLEDKQKEQDELISIWDKENRLPTDYKEIVNESLRLSEAKFKALERERDEKRLVDETSRRAEEENKKLELQKQQASKIEEINKTVTRELDILFKANVLPKPPDVYDANNDAQKEVDELMKFGIKLNQDRVARNERPIESISDIYFDHYKAVRDAKGKDPSQPPGANAPIAGARVVPTKETRNDKYDWVKDHNKSFRDILMGK